MGMGLSRGHLRRNHASGRRGWNHSGTDASYLQLRGEVGLRTGVMVTDATKPRRRRVASRGQEQERREEEDRPALLGPCHALPCPALSCRPDSGAKMI